MLPARGDGRIVTVRRTLDASEEDLVDVVTAFAVEQNLELDRRHEGDGLLFIATASGALFKRGDAVQVVFDESPSGYDVELIADLAQSLRRVSERRRGHVVRSGALAAFFAWLGVRGLIVEVGLGDFVLLGLSAMFGGRSLRYARSGNEALDELDRRVVNELNVVLDRAERG